jgi:MurNAc alpha-1-phosphate uridylyltransferase
MTDVGRTAMVLAAGLGTRMRPLTDTRPKPLVRVCGRPLIDYGLDRLRAAGVGKAVVNVHYLADQIEAWAAAQSSPAIAISDERAGILDTGGGVAKALPLLGPDPFFVLNSDSFWIDEGTPALERLRSAWNGTTMDCLLLLCPLTRTVGYGGSGDFVMAADGRVARKGRSIGEPLAYIGAYLVSPQLFEDAPSGKFSMNLLWDRAIGRNRLYGIAHAGIWLHVGTPDAIAVAEHALDQ